MRNNEAFNSFDEFRKSLRREVGLAEIGPSKPGGKTQIVSAELRGNEFEELEELRERVSMSRSQIIRAAIRRLLAEAAHAGKKTNS